MTSSGGHSRPPQAQVVGLLEGSVCGMLCGVCSLYLGALPYIGAAAKVSYYTGVSALLGDQNNKTQATVFGGFIWLVTLCITSQSGGGHVIIPFIHGQ